ncbi:hypothetical protein PQD73_gp013 [Stenotrophomonas phage Salva]|uniref:Uncharacterized protein n=1 Tax=Stenotrophomonas phage Salva TaxID=2801524 RepID=A0A7U3WJU4_9CAUD|nr:hypothetical protein PQD73_gp013 [Stenotrophomonas phage Salva]QQM18177.1 hypothetical protein CPT_Salva_013 [Stenotrophomonas phage Salva]
MIFVVAIFAVILFGNVGAKLISKLYPQDQFVRVIFQLMWWFIVIVLPFAV